MNLFDKIREGMKKTRAAVGGRLDGVISRFRKLDEDTLEELEEALILADFGAQCAAEVMERLRERGKKERIEEPFALKNVLKDIMEEMAVVGDAAVENFPLVILVVGVNGVGKTTAIGKLAGMYAKQERKVLLAAADTFRAAAADQLEIWAGRAGAQIVRHNEGADPAAVVFDAITAAKARSADVLICDTAGRLHNKQNLMNELNKISRVLERELPGWPREVLLVVDGTTGQNAITQAKEFSKTAGVTGIILTKLDGTAKGGAGISAARAVGVPIRYIGVGEGMDDLLPFDARAFVEALF